MKRKMKEPSEKKYNLVYVMPVDKKRCAFYEEHEAHPNGIAMVRGDALAPDKVKPVQIARTPAAETALHNGMIEIVPAPEPEGEDEEDDESEPALVIEDESGKLVATVEVEVEVEEAIPNITTAAADLAVDAGLIPDDLLAIEGSGKDGQILKKDVVRFLKPVATEVTEEEQ